MPLRACLAHRHGVDEGGVFAGVRRRVGDFLAGAGVFATVRAPVGGTDSAAGFAPASGVAGVPVPGVSGFVRGL
ncbi:hypothetical protein P3H15_54120, partial [Rhodococcus sp. T2V]|uniref:hypothetical protein n=1 Tax=Rhodococcus sp. T2V TaxID=3034164 RepID=UPI0023E189C8